MTSQIFPFMTQSAGSPDSVGFTNLSMNLDTNVSGDDFEAVVDLLGFVGGPGGLGLAST